MQEIFKAKLFWFMSIALAIVFFVLVSIFNRAYIGQVEILVLPKNNVTAQNIGRIMTNIKEVADVNKGNTKDSTYKLFYIKNSSIIRLETYSHNQFQAGVLAGETARQITVSMSHYYNLRTELEMRLLAEPVVFEKNIFTNPWLIVASLLFGFIVTAFFAVIKQKNSNDFTPTPKSVMSENKRIFSNIFEVTQTEKSSAVKDLPTEKKEKLAIENTIVDENFFAQAVPEKKAETVKKNSLFNHPSLANSQIKKSFAPDNLPVGEEFILNNLKLVDKKQAEEEENNQQIIANQADKTPKTHEATEDEIKARLNKLLGGGK